MDKAAFKVGLERWEGLRFVTLLLKGLMRNNILALGEQQGQAAMEQLETEALEGCWGSGESHLTKRECA